MEPIYSNYYPRFLYVDKYHFPCYWIYPSSVAPYNMLRYIVSGTAVFTLNGVPYEVQPDDVFYIPQNSTFSCEAKEEFVFISIRFVDSIQTGGMDLLTELWDVPERHSFQNQPQMKMWFEAVYANALSRNNYKMLLIRGYLNLILAMLAQVVENNRNKDDSLEDDRRKMEALSDVKSIQRRATRKTKQKNDPRILAVEHYIMTHPAENITHEKMSKVADISVSTLRRLFKAKTGKTIYAYAKEVKMTYAARRLLVTNEPISAISYELGYDTPSYFAKSFREIYGMSPQEYRKTSHEV